MSKTIRLQQIKILSEKQMKTNLKRAAFLYKQYADCDVMIIYWDSTNNRYEFFEFTALEEHFQHLAGVKHPKGAKTFFQKCLDGEIKKDDIKPVENMKTTSSKIDVLPFAIDMTSAKIYKIGHKDLVTLDCQFSIGVGNSRSVVGFDKRRNSFPIPITVMDRKISDFCSTTYTIYAVIKKKNEDIRYTDLMYERTANVFKSIKFPNRIKKKIDRKFFI